MIMQATSWIKWKSGEGNIRNKQVGDGVEKGGMYLRSWIFNMETLFHRHNRYIKLNKVIAKVTDPELKSNFIKTREEYWDKIQQLNKPNFTDEDYYQIKQEHERIDELLRKWGERLKKDKT